MRIASPEVLDRLQEQLGYQFRNARFLEQAVTHGSAKSPMRPSNERLEFLGDSILGAVVSAFLFVEYPKLNEGRMTKAKAESVSTKCLQDVAEHWELAEVMTVGKMFRRVEDIRDSIVANAVEAIIGAVYLDSGFDRARAFILEHFSAIVRTAAESPGSQDYKSLLGTWTQRQFGTNPSYRVENTSGPDHERQFDVIVVVEGEVMGRASGTSKKAAEQEAAQRALVSLGPDAEIY
jgi:ribonuclease-3